MRLRVGLLWIATALLGAACEDKERAWYNAMRADQAAFELVNDEIAEGYRAGRISEERIDQLMVISEQWGASHNAAVSALLLYHYSKSSTTEQTFLRALLEASSIVADLRRAFEQSEGPIITMRTT